MSKAYIDARERDAERKQIGTPHPKTVLAMVSLEQQILILALALHSYVKATAAPNRDQNKKTSHMMYHTKRLGV
jgi:hypothetical protein